MRCNKCGFISFDYLSQCKSCGVSLAAVRDELGFLPVRPDSPSFLTSLAGNTKVRVPEVRPGDLTEPYDSSLPEIDFGEDMEVPRAQGKEEAPPPRTASAERVSMEDLNTGELDDLARGLDLASMGDAQPEQPKAGPRSALEDVVLDLSHGELDRIMTEVEAKVSAAPPKTAEVTDDDLVIDLSERDLANLLEELRDLPEGAAGSVPASSGGKSGAKNS